MSKELPKIKDLRSRRIELGLSQWELALAAEVPRYAIQLAEQGIRGLTVEHVIALAEALGLPPEEGGNDVTKG